MIVYPLTVSFGSKGDYQIWAGEGWHHDPSDEGHTWAGHVAELRMPLPRSRVPLVLELDLIPKENNQDVFVYLNGGFAAFWHIDVPVLKTAAFGASLLRPGENTIQIVCPRAVLPGSGPDQHVFGVAVRSLRIAEGTP